SKTGSVSFLQRFSDLRHHSLHFGVRQGALGAAESQGERDALAAVLDLPAAILVESAHALQNRTRGLLEGGLQLARWNNLFDHDRKVALHGRVAGQLDGLPLA